MSSRKRIKRQKRAQEAHQDRQAVVAYQKGELPASDAENGLSVDSKAYHKRGKADGS